MPQIDLQLGGGYTYQWECAVLLALNYLLDTPLEYNSELHQLIGEFLGWVGSIHLEGKTREQEAVELEDINLLNTDRAICIQVKAKEAEGDRWVPSDPLLAKALHRFYRNQALDQDEPSIRFVFLSNRSFNPDLVRLKDAIAAGTVTQSEKADYLFNQAQRYVIKNQPTAPPLSRPRFNGLLSRLALIEFLPIDAVEANVKGKLQALGVEAWQEAYEHLYTRFSKGSVRTGGTRVTRADLVDSLEHFSGGLALLRIPPTALYQLPPDIADFTGRHKEITRVASLLEQAVEAEGTAVVISAVAGMAGVGKSALAVHIAHCLENHFPDAQLYVNLGGAEGQPLDSFDVLAGFLRALGVEDQFIPEGLDGRTGLYRSRLSDKRALVLLDNAYDEAQVRPLLPGSPTCAVLVTSRRRLSALEGATVINLEVMLEDEALELLGTLASAECVRSELEAARKIISLCGWLPLAIRIAGGKLRDKPHWSLEHYVSRLDDERRRLKRLQLGDLDVRASFALSYRDLAPDDAHLFRLLVLAGDSFSPEIAALLLEVELDTAWEALERLVDLQLLEPAGGGRYRFHDLMRLFAQEQLDQQESAEEQQVARSRAERWYLMASEVHFYTQAAILDRYVHSSNPAADSEILQAILTVLETRKNLRRYFFRSGPSAAWAPILWERGFFDSPPPPQKTETGYVLPPWDVQYYLLSVAAEVPDVVVKVAESIEGEGWYIAQAIRSLCYIPAEQAEKPVPRIIEWLDDLRISRSIARETASLVVYLAQNEQLDAALDLLHALTAPIPPSDLKNVGGRVWGAEAASKFPDVHHAREFFDQGLLEVAELEPGRVVAILQEHLCTSIRLEAEALDSPDFETSSWWRSAIEETDQDRDRDHKDQLLQALRDTLEMWVQQDASAVEPLIRRYLSDGRGILRRLGLHIVHRFPTRYTTLATDELRKVENLDDADIHHEFFMLLQKGFPLLDASDQTALIAAICDGPPPEQVRELAEWARENRGADVEGFSRRHIKGWIRDRLWMVQDYLSGVSAETLKELTDEIGPPEFPPEFTRWVSDAFQVGDITPIPEQELARMSPEELVRYVQEWRPDPQQPFGSEQITCRGLANVVATVILAATQRYEDQLATVVLSRPEFAWALLARIKEEKPETSDTWEFAIGLCEILLEDQIVRSDMTRTLDVSWIDVRQAIVRLIQLGLNNKQHRIPAHLLSRVRDLLLVLLDDPDPDEAADRPPEGWSGHEDPATLAINRVRPSALLALTEYAWLRARATEETSQEPHREGAGPRRLEPVVREALARKLDRREDPSWAVHSVYGRRLLWLFWLDKQWVENHIDQIFPEGEDEDSVRYFVAAWDSYVSFHRFWSASLELLRPKYERAIDNLSKNRVTKTHVGMGPETGLAVHVAGEYLRSDYDLRSPVGPHNLIGLLYHEATPRARGGVSWFFWRALQGGPNNRETYWPKVRAVWEWRTEEASAANHSTDFDDEMQWFAHLLPLIPESETMASLWPLLEALLPHITRSKYRTTAWDATERYLAAEVDHDPVKAIRFYHLMHEQRPQSEWYRASDEARKIIETAAADRNACHDALLLIGLLAQRGNHEFRDVYERHVGCLPGGTS